MKVNQNKSEQPLNLFLGITNERADELGKIHGDKFIKWYENTSDEIEPKEANQLLASFLEDCQTIEEVVLVSVGFKERYERGIEMMIIKEADPLKMLFSIMDKHFSR